MDINIDIADLDAVTDQLNGRIPQATIEELVTLRSDARISAENLTAAIAAQAEKYAISKGALRRYVCALESDAMDKLDSEAEDLARLIMAHEKKSEAA
jgi:hypothetical protein